VEQPVKKFRRVEKIVEAKATMEDSFLLESQSNHINGARRIGYRPGWVIRDGGVEVWLPDDEFQRNYVEVVDGPVDLKILAEIIDSGRRVLAQRAHPDLGHDEKRMTEINTAADSLRAFAARRKNY